MTDRTRCCTISVALLACRWIERQPGQVPMLFVQLAEGVRDEAGGRAALDELVARKKR